MNDYATGKILTQMAQGGALDPSTKQKFWAKSYGNHALEVGDEIEISVTMEYRLYDGTGRDDGWRTESVPMREAWKVTGVQKKEDHWRSEWITYFERVI